MVKDLPKKPKWSLKPKLKEVDYDPQDDEEDGEDEADQQCGNIVTYCVKDWIL